MQQNSLHLQPFSSGLEVYGMARLREGKGSCTRKENGGCNRC